MGVLLENDKTTCFGQSWPSSGFYPKNYMLLRVFICSMQTRFDVEISSSRGLSFSVCILHTNILTAYNFSDNNLMMANVGRNT